MELQSATKKGDECDRTLEIGYSFARDSLFR